MNNENADYDLNQFLCFKGKEKVSPPSDEKFFTREKTLTLLDLYKKYKKRLGSFEVRSMKKMWEVIAKDFSNMYHITIPPAKFENRFRVLERKYKKVVDNNNLTGRGRKIFDFEQEMDEIFEKKRNVKPLLVLSSLSVEKPTPEIIQNANAPSCTYEVVPSDYEVDIIADIDHETNPVLNIPESVNDIDQGDKTEKLTPKRLLKRKRIGPAYRKRNDILLEMKNDLREFYEKKDKREEEKLEISKKKMEDRIGRTHLLREYLDFVKQQKNNGDK